MKSTSIVRKEDEFGRIVFPVGLRRKLDIDIKGSIEFFIDGEQVLLRKYTAGCSQCGVLGTVFKVGNIKVCEACRNFCTGLAVGCFIGEARNFSSSTVTNKLGHKKCRCQHK